MLRHTLLGIGITLVIMALLLALDLNPAALHSPQESVMTEKEVIKEAKKLGMIFPEESYSFEGIKLEKKIDLEDALSSLQEDNMEQETKAEVIADQNLSVQDKSRVEEVLKSDKIESDKAASEDQLLETEVSDNDENTHTIDTVKEASLEEDIKKELARQLKEQLKAELKKELKEELENKKVLMTIPKGISSSEVATLLFHQGVIDNKEYFISTVDKLGLATKIKAGTYSFQLPISVKEILVELTSNN